MTYITKIKAMSLKESKGSFGRRNGEKRCNNNNNNNDNNNKKQQRNNNEMSLL